MVDPRPRYRVVRREPHPQADRCPDAVLCHTEIGVVIVRHRKDAGEATAPVSVYAMSPASAAAAMVFDALDVAMEAGEL